MRGPVGQLVRAVVKRIGNSYAEGRRRKDSLRLFAEPLEERRLLAVVGIDPSEEVETVEASPESATELTRTVNSSRDDAEEKSNGKIQLGNSDLELVDDRSNTGRTVGIRFQNIEIPSDATILSAYILFTIDEADTGAVAVEIAGESTADAAAFSSQKRNISSRTKTDTSIFWSPEAWNVVGEAGEQQQTPDLASVVDETIKTPDWAPGNAMAFLLTGSGTETAESYDGQASAAPQLHIVFDAPNVTPPDSGPGGEPSTDPGSKPDPQPPPESDPQTILTRFVAQRSDDARENSKGRVRYTESDLKTSNLLGLRFQNISIPQGRQIVDARIQFQVDRSTTGATNLNIFGQLAEDAETFSTARYDLSSRPLTIASVEWTPPAWGNVGEAGPDQQTPNLAPILQEIVDQDGWASGSSIVFTVSGSGRREAESFESGFAPVLTIQLSEPVQDIIVVDDVLRTEKYQAEAAKDRIFDARDASFLISETDHGMILLRGDESQTGMQWQGGYVTGDKPWDASWDEWKNDPQTQSSSAITNLAHSATITGLHMFNVHDGVRIADEASDWTVENVWGEYIRDDAIENDHLHSGKVVDSLFDGAYTGISTRPALARPELNGTGEVMTLDRVLLRLEATPYPYKYDEKPGILDESGDSWNGTAVPYGHGNLFKYDHNDIERNMHFVIKDSVFVLPHDNVTSNQISFPPAELIDELSNVTIVWLGAGEFPGYLPTEKFPGEITILTGQEGRDFWQQKVTDWHQRHPDVDPARKPANPGTIDFPKVF